MLSIYRDDIKENVATVALEIGPCGTSADKPFFIRATHGSSRPPLALTQPDETRCRRVEMAQGRLVRCAHEGAACATPR